eukprot:2865746-Pyramimonas_sp.AAC.1
MNTVIVNDESFTLGLLISLRLIEYKDAIVRISTEATQEASLEQLLHKVQAKWTGVELIVK